MRFDIKSLKPETVVQTYDHATRTEGIMVIDNTALGPGKGGIRMVPDISVQEVERLAKAMTFKNALAKLPFGGAKSGIRMQHGMDKDKAMRAFARGIRKFIHDEYVAGPDMNTTENEMRSFAEELNDTKACTGKPDDMGGLPHELGSTGFGVAHSAMTAMGLLGMDVGKARVAIEGFGNVGTFTARFLHEKGAKIVAISDLSGCLYDAKGLDVPSLLKHRDSNQYISNFPHDHFKLLPKEELFKLEADVLIPGARPDAINDGNKAAVKARLVVEAANIPASNAVERELEARGIAIVPDIVANAGGVISSYVEFIDGTEAQMFSLVKKTVTENTQTVIKKHLETKRDSREISLEMAGERICAAMEKRMNAG
ncbi:MAG: Glu/Leu/Phe/Val dehydrogenase [Candidatus Micrarchaeota archaeon]